jgi:hypothetical protein
MGERLNKALTTKDTKVHEGNLRWFTGTSVLAAGGVVSGASLDFVVLLVLDLEFAVGAV